MPQRGSSAKVQRWIDLLAALLGRQRALTFEELARDVPAYTASAKDSAKRTFERDKKELRAFGVPIETVGSDGAADAAYRLRTSDFYLPYLHLTTPRGAQRPSRVDKYGYHSLKSLAFDADELRAVADGAARARRLGNPVLAADVDSALRKLGHDLPVGAVERGDEETHIVLSRAPAPADSRTLQRLGDALHGRKAVRFAYAAPTGADIATRHVEPYGLFFLGGNWYLVGRDVNRAALRNFRVNRIADVKLVSPTKDLPEYEIPREFHLREHARSRHAWELGDDDATQAIIEVRGQSGAARAAANLGAPVEGVESQRRFTVRRVDVFSRWLMSFAGELVPLSPPRLVEEMREQIARTAAIYIGHS
jgi:predicted DNA-binding transcriptional regulator YafY